MVFVIKFYRNLTGILHFCMSLRVNPGVFISISVAFVLQREFKIHK